MQRTLFLCALVSVLSVLFITVFIFAEGLPVFRGVRPLDFIFGTRWQPWRPRSTGLRDPEPRAKTGEGAAVDGKVGGPSVRR